jgi:hypothetical protein
MYMVYIIAIIVRHLYDMHKMNISRLDRVSSSVSKSEITELILIQFVVTGSVQKAVGRI